MDVGRKRLNELFQGKPADAYNSIVEGLPGART